MCWVAAKFEGLGESAEGRAAMGLVEAFETGDFEKVAGVYVSLSLSLSLLFFFRYVCTWVWVCVFLCVCVCVVCGCVVVAGVGGCEGVV